MTTATVDDAAAAYNRCLDMFTQAAVYGDDDYRAETEAEALANLDAFVTANAMSVAVLHAADTAAETTIRERLGMDRHDTLPEDIALRAAFVTCVPGQFPGMAVGRVSARLHGRRPDAFGDLATSVVHGDWTALTIAALLELTSQLRAGQAEVAAQPQEARS